MKLFWSNVCFVLMVLSLSCQCMSVASDGVSYQFKVGDHVDVDRNMSSGPTPANGWRAGIIRKVADGGYYVELDDYPGGPDEWVLIPARAGKWTRPSHAAANNVATSTPQPPAGNGVAGAAANAGASPGSVGVGQRVDIDPLMSTGGTTPHERWKSGVIRKIADGAYWVELDERPGAANLVAIPIDKRWTRPGNNPPAVVNADAATQPLQASHPPLQQAPLGQTPRQQRNDADVAAHTGPHVPTAEHVKMMITAMKVFALKHDYDRVSVDFKSVSVGAPTRDTSASAAYARRVGVTVYPVSVNYVVKVENNSGLRHAYEYDSKFYWYIDTRGECTLDVIAGGVFKSQLY